MKRKYRGSKHHARKVGVVYAMDCDGREFRLQNPFAPGEVTTLVRQYKEDPEVCTLIIANQGGSDLVRWDRSRRGAPWKKR